MGISLGGRWISQDGHSWKFPNFCLFTILHFILTVAVINFWLIGDWKAPYPPRNRRSEYRLEQIFQGQENRRLRHQGGTGRIQGNHGHRHLRRRQRVHGRVQRRYQGWKIFQARFFVGKWRVLKIGESCLNWTWTSLSKICRTFVIWQPEY